MGVETTIESPDLKLQLTGAALFTATSDQFAALLDIAKRFKAHYAYVSKGGWGLPDGYLSFTLADATDTPMLYGGVDAEGRVST